MSTHAACQGHHRRSGDHAAARLACAFSPVGAADYLPLDFTGIFPEPMPDPSNGSQPALSRLLART